jgi:hypothetical protein
MCEVLSGRNFVSNLRLIPDIRLMAARISTTLPCYLKVILYHLLHMICPALMIGFYVDHPYIAGIQV